MHFYYVLLRIFLIVTMIKQLLCIIKDFSYVISVKNSPLVLTGMHYPYLADEEN